MNNLNISELIKYNRMGFLGGKYFQQYSFRIFILKEVQPNYKEITKLSLGSLGL